MGSFCPGGPRYFNNVSIAAHLAYNRLHQTLHGKSSEDSFVR